jgi:hypothetical protein
LLTATTKTAFSSEIVNPAITIRVPNGNRRTNEMAFRMSRFRPLRATNIDVFLEMLEPATRTAKEQATV